jgi:spermidine synthase
VVRGGPLRGRAAAHLTAGGAPATAAAAVEGTGWSFRTWAVLYGLAGFQALSLEILWFRLLGIMVKASAFTFGTLLTVYLSGLGIGAAIGTASLRRVRRPALIFLALQAFVGLYAVASTALLIGQLESGRLLSELRAYLSGYEPFDAAWAFRAVWRADAGRTSRFLMLYFGLPALLVGPPTLAMGASFPFLQKVVLVDLARIGRRVGTVLVANIAGAAAGSIVTGWIALNVLGSSGTLRALGLMSAGFAGLAVVVLTASRAATARWTAAAAATLLAVAIAFQTPNEGRLWAQLHGATPRTVLRNEDATGVSVIKIENRGLATAGVVFVNGIGQSWIPYGNIHSVLGALPAFVHPNPRSAALIGLGSGDTLYSLAGRQELAKVVSIEIIRPQLATLKEWERRTGYPALTHLLSDPRIEHIAGDGRIHIMRSEQRFDIIEADALRPTSAYSGNLYSVGYFELLRSRLSDNGIAVTWAPTPRILDTFASVFPHVVAFGDVLLGSPSPIPYGPDAVRERLSVPAVQTYFNRAGIDIEALLLPYLTRTPQMIDRDPKKPVPADLNHDLFPRDEFSMPRAAAK